MNVENVTIECDERGFELHLLVDDDPILDDSGRLILNIHQVAEQLHDQAVKVIGPWLQEMNEARRDFDAGEMERIVREEEGLAAGESAMDYFQRTGDAEPLREQADDIRDRAKGGA